MMQAARDLIISKEVSKMRKTQSGFGRVNEGRRIRSGKTSERGLNSRSRSNSIDRKKLKVMKPIMGHERYINFIH